MRNETPTPPPRPGSQMWAPKDDQPPQLGAWAPGSYLCECRLCRDFYIGDKRSAYCAECAYKPEPPKGDAMTNTAVPLSQGSKWPQHINTNLPEYTDNPPRNS